MTPHYDRTGITIYHADCLALMPKMAPDSFDCVLTDPPYLVGYTGRWDSGLSQIVGDNDPTWVRVAFEEIWRLMKPDTFCVSFYGWPHADIFLGIWKSIGFRPVSHLAFVKNHIGLGRMSRGKHETAYLLAKGKPPIPQTVLSDVIDWQREELTFHQNQKPVASLVKLLTSFCPDNGVVLDPFMGSGSTLRAAKNLRLSEVGIEIELKYCRTAARRMAQSNFDFYLETL